MMVGSRRVGGSSQSLISIIMAELVRQSQIRLSRPGSDCSGTRHRNSGHLAEAQSQRHGIVDPWWRHGRAIGLNIGDAVAHDNGIADPWHREFDIAWDKGRRSYAKYDGLASRGFGNNRVGFVAGAVN